VRVSLIDDAFTSWLGHSAAYDFAIGEELARRCIEYRIFAHENTRTLTPTHDNLQPTFKWWASAVRAAVKWKYLPAKLNAALGLVWANLGHFKDLLTKVSPFVQDNDIVLVCFQAQATSYAVALWLLYLAMRRTRVTAILVVHNVPSKFLKVDVWFLRLLGVRQRVVLAAHTQPIAELCQQSTGQPCVLLPLPFTSVAGALPANQSPVLYPVNIACLGLATFAKGFDLVVDTINLLEDLLSAGTIKLIMQCNTPPENDRMRQLQDALIEEALTKVGIKVITGPLSMEEYYREMDAADVVLIPSRPTLYTYRYALSGVFTEALARGKPVIVSAGTYMATQLEQHGAGLKFQSGSPTALAEAIRVISTDIGAWKAKAASARESWLRVHNPQRYVDILLELGQAL
jgi:glycosyltransferase involved in cell wall biosynthesis